jgi:hypothetical protein
MACRSSSNLSGRCPTAHPACRGSKRNRLTHQPNLVLSRVAHLNRRVGDRSWIIGILPPDGWDAPFSDTFIAEMCPVLRLEEETGNMSDGMDHREHHASQTAAAYVARELSEQQQERF